MRTYYPKYRPAKKVPAKKFVKKLLDDDYVMKPMKKYRKGVIRRRPDLDTVHEIVESLSSRIREIRAAEAVLSEALEEAIQTLYDLEYELEN